ncbi:hypothetical protein R5R35_011646 [Gryllus longicercus]|uniref:PLAC domain-containing protein n=1 Tax=Gryllus longicercus TaxID=2509291 RepID=A0AAN9Z295_9ORTH
MRPEHERSCVGHDCGPDWFAAEWTTCSRDCGGGIQRRDVRCLDQHQRPSSDCSDERRPATKRTCNTHECGTSQNGNGSGTTENRLKDDPIPSRDSGDQAISTDEKSVHDDECVDKIANCHLVVQARLCTLSKLYRTSCCHSCHKKL